MRLMRSDHSPSQREVRTGTQGSYLETGTETEAMEERGSGSPLTACSTFFVRHPRTTCLKLTPPTVGWAPPRQSSIINQENAGWAYQ